MTTTMTVTAMTVTGGSDLESGGGSLRDTVTGDEKSPPPTDVTACTCEHDTTQPSVNMTVIQTYMNYKLYATTSTTTEH